jgi:hypothetical protein
MADVIKAAIGFVMSNYSLTFLVIGLLFSLIAIARASKPVGREGGCWRMAATTGWSGR